MPVKKHRATNGRSQMPESSVGLGPPKEGEEGAGLTASTGDGSEGDVELLFVNAAHGHRARCESRGGSHLFSLVANDLWSSQSGDFAGFDLSAVEGEGAGTEWFPRVPSLHAPRLPWLISVTRMTRFPHSETPQISARSFPVSPPNTFTTMQFHKHAFIREPPQGKSTHRIAKRSVREAKKKKKETT